MTDRETLLETEKAMRDSLAPLDLDFEAAHAVSSIYRAANAIRAYVTNEVLRPYDLTWTGFVVLWVVWIWKALETRRAAEAAAISKATLSGVVKTLESRRWIERRASPEDGRLVHLVLTPSGVRLMEEIFPKFNEAEAQVVSSLTSRRKTEMTRSLREIVTRLEATQ
ncbi:MarR family winged helix-turn-helix transcriptional regulator [Mycolicibacterium litorale]|uniref:MarR family winged helix-turn-helix transcriptional regulator n=1 Tax=Mycolicibacterium litorale TaxID=758802 RepID=UPI003CED273C